MKRMGGEFVGERRSAQAGSPCHTGDVDRLVLSALLSLNSSQRAQILSRAAVARTHHEMHLNPGLRGYQGYEKTRSSFLFPSVSIRVIRGRCFLLRGSVIATPVLVAATPRCDHLR